MSQKKVLLADDDPKMRALLRMSLGDRFVLLEAGDGQQALEMARKEKPDLVLLDIAMPGLDGLEVCRLLRQGPETKGIAVVMLTGRDAEADIRRARELGAADYVTKPFSPRALLDKVVEVLS
ncbi:MAG: response regulator [Chloroflexi bacterium]|nr:response regulator [Chloroflexota bacterium]